MRSSSRIRALEAAGSRSVRPGTLDLGNKYNQHQKWRRRGENVTAAGRYADDKEQEQASAFPTTYVAPFSLRSIDITILSLGRIHRGAWQHKYWSSSGCLYHHAYPVGFRAVKSGVFGRHWECRVEEGEAGPLFVVESGCGGGAASGNRRFAGPTPTRPWTDACLAHRTGQRISGPLFFGFSDPATQAAVEQMYTPQELAAARRGEGGRRREAVENGEGGGGNGDDANNNGENGRPSPSSSSYVAAERAALDFMSRYRIGETTACVLAHTTALSGKRFASAYELEAWARGGGGGGRSGGGGGGGRRGGSGKENEKTAVGTAAAAAAAAAAAELEAGGGGGWPPRARLLLDFLLNSEEFSASTRRWPAWRLRMAPRLVVAVCGLVRREEEEEGEEEERKKQEEGGEKQEASAAAAVEEKEEKVATTKRTQQQKRRAADAPIAPVVARSVPARVTRRTRR